MKIKNFAKATVSTGYDAAATSIALTAGHGAKFPSKFPYNLTWWNSTDYPDPSDDPNVEIVKVTARSTDTLTVIRGQEGTTASTKNTASKTYTMIGGLTKDFVEGDMHGGVFDSRNAPRLSDYTRRLNVTNNPDWTQLGGISSITYNALRNTLWLSDQITGGNGRFYETDLDGRLIRTITNSGFIDTEGICWMYGTWYAIVEEDRNDIAGQSSRITLCNIADNATTNTRTTAGNVSWELSGTGLGDMGNLGCEGVSYDPDRDLLYFITEKSSAGNNTSGIWNLWSLDPNDGTIKAVCNLLTNVGPLTTDISDLYFDRNTQTVILLCEEGDELIRIDLQGNVIENLSLAGMYTQPEGICFSPDLRYMFIAGELDEFSRWDAPGPFVELPGENTVAYTWSCSSPAVGGIPGPRLHRKHTVERIDAYVTAATSATFNIEHRTTIGSAGTNTMTADLAATTTGASQTTFASSAMDRGSWLWLDISAVSGTPGNLVVTITCRVY
jgi:uncharacterized protein YjiK